ncbi:GAD-like domain-containing protein [Rhizobium rhizophilum]|uniref:GAD-like domain-containing protein n=1 Tax=Rhizobium rhizophilum TaxID=1850373 RepID=UPI001F294D46|nr:GAD-like domain-containing protein [Rhizobium rhizophilum]
MDKNFLERIDRIGQPQRCEALTSEQDMRLSRHLPEAFMMFLRKYGFGDYFGRKLQYCDPDLLSPILELLFKRDPDFGIEDCFVVAYSAFGRLVCWSERHDHFEIDLIDQRLTSSELAPTQFVLPPHLANRPRSTDPNILARSLLPYESKDYEEFDSSDQPMFERCQNLHGKLERGECYGYFPAIASVGQLSPARKIENIKRVQALEHFSILAQLGAVRLMRLERGQYSQVRLIS